MKVNVQFNCPVSAIVDTETGEIDSVHVWDEHLGDEPQAIHMEGCGPGLERMRKFHERTGRMPMGSAFYRFEPLPISDPHAFRALEVLATPDIEWPGWEFGP